MSEIYRMPIASDVSCCSIEIAAKLYEEKYQAKAFGVLMSIDDFNLLSKAGYEISDIHPIISGEAGFGDYWMVYGKEGFIYSPGV